MPEQQQREILAAQLRGHELASAKLAEELRNLGGPGRESAPAPGADHEAIFMSAQILRHRIAMALLASRLATRATG